MLNIIKKIKDNFLWKYVHSDVMKVNLNPKKFIKEEMLKVETFECFLKKLYLINSSSNIVINSNKSTYEDIIIESLNALSDESYLNLYPEIINMITNKTNFFYNKNSEEIKEIILNNKSLEARLLFIKRYTEYLSKDNLTFEHLKNIYSIKQNLYKGINKEVTFTPLFIDEPFKINNSLDVLSLLSCIKGYTTKNNKEQLEIINVYNSLISESSMDRILNSNSIIDNIDFYIKMFNVNKEVTVQLKALSVLKDRLEKENVLVKDRAIIFDSHYFIIKKDDYKKINIENLKEDDIIYINKIKEADINKYKDITKSFDFKEFIVYFYTINGLSFNELNYIYNKNIVNNAALNMYINLKKDFKYKVYKEIKSDNIRREFDIVDNIINI